jgi:anti-anti-sigma regulatory factor
MDFVLTEDGVPQLTLPPVADLTCTGTLQAVLVEAQRLGTGIDIDAGDVQRITTPCLQLLVAAAKSFETTGGPPLVFSKMSEAFSDAATTLAIDCVLRVKGE